MFTKYCLAIYTYHMKLKRKAQYPRKGEQCYREEVKLL